MQNEPTFLGADITHTQTHTYTHSLIWCVHINFCFFLYIFMALLYAGSCCEYILNTLHWINWTYINLSVIAILSIDSCLLIIWS